MRGYRFMIYCPIHTCPCYARHAENNQSHRTCGSYASDHLLQERLSGHGFCAIGMNQADVFLVLLRHAICTRVNQKHAVSGLLWHGRGECSSASGPNTFPRHEAVPRTTFMGVMHSSSVLPFAGRNPLAPLTMPTIPSSTQSIASSVSPSPSSLPFPFPFPMDTTADRTSYLTNTITSVIASVTPMLALLYFCALFWCYRYAQRHPRPLNKTSGVRLQRYAPLVYAFMVFSSLAEIALASWLLLQYRFHRNYPNMDALTGVRLLLFCACWTTVTAGVYTLLFLHPIWSRWPISSIGAQAIWVLVTWLFWVVGAAIVNTAAPDLLARGMCIGLVYCRQIQTLFAFAVLEIITLTMGMMTMMWLAWQSTRSILHPEPSK